MLRRRQRNANVYSKGYLQALLYTSHKKTLAPARNTFPPRGILTLLASPFVYVYKSITMLNKKTYTPLPGSVLSVNDGFVLPGARIRAKYLSPALTVALIALCFSLLVLLAYGAIIVLPASVTVIDEGETFRYVTTERDAHTFLSQNGFDIREGDYVSVSLDGRGSLIDIDRAFDVFVQSLGETQRLSFRGGAVSDALEAAGAVIDEDDELNFNVDAPLHSGMVIEVVSVERQTEIETQALEFKIEEKEDASIPRGSTKKLREGKDGVKELRYEVELRDGVVAARTLVEEVVTKEPVNRVVLIGTGKPVRYQTKLMGDKRIYKDPPKQQDVYKVLEMEVTAYTHTGNRTATGRRPRIGTIAVNPEQIPYGTKLYVPGYGYGVAEDTGAFRHTDRMQIVVFIDTERECIKWGRKRGVKVYLLK